MSDQLTGALFDPEVFTHPAWWIGRVETKESWSDNIQGETFTNIAEVKGWGQRYKVRVFNWHTGDTDKVKDRKSTRLNSSHVSESRMPSSA